MKTFRKYRASEFFLPNFPFAIVHTVNRTEDFNRERRFKREFWKITYIVSGTGRILISDSAFPIHAGSIFMSHPEAVTTYDMETTSLELYNILFDRSFLDHDIESLKDHFQFFAIFSDSFRQEDNATIYIQNANQRIRNLIREMENEDQEKATNYRVFLKLQLLELLILMLRSGERQMRSASREKIAAFIHHILKTSYKEKITLARLAKQVGMTPNHLCLLYRQINGNSIIADLKKIRLEHAATMLTAERHKISEVCCECGFQDLSYFYRSFKQYYGCNPGKYREKIG